MRLAAWLGDVLTSRLFWELRASTLCISLLAIWIGIIMTSETIVYTPAEFLPVLVLIGLIVSVFFTVLWARTEYDNTTKENLRKGIISEKPSFGMDYLSAYTGMIVIGVVGAFLIPGMIYNALDAEPVLSGCAIIAGAWSVIIGVLGAKTAAMVIDLFRNNVKIADLLTAAKKKTE